MLPKIKFAPKSVLRVLDVGCGNARFASFLAQHASLLAPRAGAEQLHYNGCDASSELLHAAERRLRSIDCVANLRLANLLGNDYQGCPRLTDGGPFDLVTCFGVMHHIPAPLQKSLLRRCLEAAAPAGTICVSFWQFGADPRFARRRVPWTTAIDEGLLREDQLDELDGDDWLLRWGQHTENLVRYCRHNSHNAIRALVSGLGTDHEQGKGTNLESIRTDFFDADGASGHLNRYAIIRREATV